MESYRRTSFENAGYDMTFIENLNKYGGRTLLNLLKEASWMYRWHMSSADLYHQSGMGTDVEGRPNIFRTTF
jgi:hypothetical protein